MLSAGYATLGDLAGYNATDPKAAALNLPPPDSLNAWPWIIGDATRSPRVEVPLSGGPIGGSGLIQVVNNVTFKLVRGTQSVSMFPGVHMPNSTDDGSNSGMSCGLGQLYNLDVDSVEHHDLSNDTQYAAVLLAIQKRAAELDETYFQSDGVDKADPAASAAAVAKYGGFWGPWLPPGPVPTPPTPAPPPPPNPNPPAAGHFLKVGQLCLGVPGTDWVVHMGPCDSTSKWSMDNTTNAVFNVAVTGKYRFLRHSPPSTNCGVGNTVILGEQTPAVYVPCRPRDSCPLCP